MSLLRLLGWSKNRLKRHDKRLRARVRKGVEMPKFKKRQCTKKNGECCYCDKVKCCFCARPGEPVNVPNVLSQYGDFVTFWDNQVITNTDPRIYFTPQVEWESVSWDLETPKPVQETFPIDEFNDDGSEEDHTE
jgi:hypothetical protein